MTFDVRQGGCVELMAAMPAGSVDAICTDPPYGLEFMGRGWDRFDGASIDPAFGHWLAGFIDGEGCFHIHRKPQGTFDCQFSIALRGDDMPILERCHRQTGLGTLAMSRRDGNPQGRWTVSSKAACVALRDLLRAFPLRAKKAHDFELWSDAVDEWVAHERGEWDSMEEIRATLMDSRAYVDGGVRVDPFQMWCWRWGREALRVLKPGGHLLAMGGTRTYHRLTAGLEDAGFEIRDCITYLYGSGFPKSLNVSAAIDKARVEDREPTQHVAAFLRDALKRSDLSQREFEERIGLGFNSACNFNQPNRKSFAVPNWERWLSFKAVLDFGDAMDAEVWRLNGRKGVPGENWEKREVIGHSENQAGVGWVEAGQAGYKPEYDLTAPATPEARQWAGWGTALKPAHEPVVVARKPLSGTVAATVLEYGTGALNVDATRIGYEGGGNLASSPSLRDSIAGGNGGHVIATETERRYSTPEPAGRWPANVVLGHTERCAPSEREPDDRSLAHAQASDADSAYTSGPLAGCTPDCPVRLLDEQTGQTTSGAMRREVDGYDGDSMFFAGRSGPSNQHGDSGGASRFFKTVNHNHEEVEGEDDSGEPATQVQGLADEDVADQDSVRASDAVRQQVECLGEGCDQLVGTERSRYVAKASRGERNAGLEGFEEKPAGVHDDDAYGWPKNGDGSPRGKKVEPRANVHPTVKPISLMRWLVRLVTPPGGTVLDPFCGSGSTGCAAVLEGFDFVGLEREEEYVEIARARIAWWHKHRGDGEAADILAAGEARDEVEATGQSSLFD